jgi:hypothetical protein
VSAKLRQKPRNGSVLPLPPYGAAVLDAVRNRRHLNTFIIATPNSWDRFRNRIDKVVLPPDATPDDFDWRIFRGQEPIIIADDADVERIKRLIWLLLRAQAKVVCVLFLENGIAHCRHFRHD